MSKPICPNPKARDRQAERLTVLRRLTDWNGGLGSISALNWVLKHCPGWEQDRELAAAMRKRGF